MHDCATKDRKRDASLDQEQLPSHTKTRMEGGKFLRGDAHVTKPSGCLKRKTSYPAKLLGPRLVFP
jgi:hypothetical protein